MNVGFGEIIQYGYVVADVEKAAADWAERLGAGPFYVLERVLMDQYFFRGVRMDVECASDSVTGMASGSS